MNQSTGPELDVERSYETLLSLWTSGIRDYNSLLSDYLTANSIFVAAIGFLVAHEPATKVFSVLVFVLCIFGMIVTLQMAILLGRFDAQNALWEWRLRGIERRDDWRRLRLFEDLSSLKDRKTVIADATNQPSTFHSTWALAVHRRWWARRAVSFPLFFAILYSLFLIWSLTQLFGSSR